jgi:hypothetical protein
MRGAIPVTEAAGPKVDAVAVGAPPAAHGAERAAAEAYFHPLQRKAARAAHQGFGERWRNPNRAGPSGLGNWPGASNGGTRDDGSGYS